MFGSVISPTVQHGSVTLAEFPSLPSGEMLQPEIIASSPVLGAHATPSTEEAHPNEDVPTFPGTFDSIAVYDGHRVGVGRIVVDSSWHHFLDINLIGDPVAKPPRNE